MTFFKYKVDPAMMQAKINIGLSAAPTVCLSDPEATIQLTLTLSIDSSVKEGRPITIMTNGSPLHVYKEGDGGLDVFARNTFGCFRSTEFDNNKRSISMGFFFMNARARDHSEELRELGYRFITVPGDGSTTTVTHKLGWERIFEYEEKLTKDDLVPGESFMIRLPTNRLGTMWWCWGDLDADLKDKKLHLWHRGPYSGKKPDDDFVRDGNWVLGEEPMLLDWHNVTEGQWATFEFTE
ncbi:hypothetical protein F4802DRAFT_549222 [Xylaria palmicola]|nr:hypothetical protein F4802DRAFT_549222 [Xylaria palmicola]